MATEVKNGASITELVQGIVADVGDLVRQEVRFARKEITSDLRKTRNAAAYLFAGGAVALVGLILLSLSVGHLLHWLSLPAEHVETTARLPLWAAHGIVSLVLLAIGGALSWMGYQKFENVLPEQTLETVQENVAWMTSSNDVKNANSK
jgi:uncharacterized membrane protein YqjE